AIRASWEFVRRTLKATPDMQLVRPDAHELHRFVGFIEGRLKTLAPDWWREVLLDAQGYSPDQISPGWPKKPLYHETSPKKIKVPLDTSLRNHGLNVELQAGSDKLTLPAAVFDDLLKNYGSTSLSVCMDAKHCALAFHYGRPAPYTLVYLDRRTAKP